MTEPQLGSPRDPLTPILERFSEHPFIPSQRITQLSREYSSWLKDRESRLEYWYTFQSIFTKRRISEALNKLVPIAQSALVYLYIKSHVDEKDFERLVPIARRAKGQIKTWKQTISDLEADTQRTLFQKIRDGMEKVLEAYGGLDRFTEMSEEGQREVYMLLFQASPMAVSKELYSSMESVVNFEVMFSPGHDGEDKVYRDFAYIKFMAMCDLMAKKYFKPLQEATKHGNSVGISDLKENLRMDWDNEVYRVVLWEAEQLKVTVDDCPVFRDLLDENFSY